MGQREGAPLLLIDIAVPRDIDPECREIDGVSLHDVDDVQAIVERNATGREAEARRAERILDAELSRFERWLGSLEVLPTVAALRERADEIVAPGPGRERARAGRASRRRRPRADRGDGAGDRQPAAARADPAAEGQRRPGATPTCT